MTRRALGFASTLLLMLALVTCVLWAQSYRSSAKLAFDEPGTLWTIASSNGELVVAADDWGGRPKSLGLAAGETDLRSWRDFDTRLRATIKAGVHGGQRGFTIQSGRGANGEIQWRLWAVPYWALAVVLAAPALIRLLARGTKRPPTTESSTS